MKVKIEVVFRDERRTIELEASEEIIDISDSNGMAIRQERYGPDSPVDMIDRAWKTIREGWVP